jgi:hypothetical protein
MIEGCWKVLELTRDGYIKQERGTGRKCPVRLAEDSPPRLNRMGVSVGRKKFASVDLVPRELTQG